MRLIFIFFSALCFSQNNNTYITKWIDENNGLNQATAKSLAIDENDFLWIGTEMGLFKYDGSRVKLYENDHYNLIESRINYMARNKDDQSISFVVSPGNNIYTLKNNQIIKIENKKHLPYYLFIQNNVYTNSNRVLNKIFKNKNYLKAYNALEYDNFKYVFFSSNNLYFFTKNKLTIFNENGLMVELALNIMKDHKKFILNNKVYIYENDLKEIFNAKIIQSKNKVSPNLKKIFASFFISKEESQFYFDDKKTFLKHKSKIFEIVEKNNIIDAVYLFDSPDHELTNIHYNQKTGIYFIGTYTKGLVTIKSNHFNTIFFPNPVYNSVINSNYAVAELNDSTWVSSTGWFFNTKTQKAIQKPIPNDANVWYLFSYNNKVYINTKKGLVNIETKEQDMTYFSQVNQKSRFYSFCKYNNTIWANRDSSVVKIEKGKTIEIPILKTYFGSNLVIKYLSNLSENEIIIATELGVYKYNNQSKKLLIIKGLEHVNARYLKMDNEAFWVGTYGQGLFYVSDKIYKVRFKNPKTNTAHAIEEDQRGNLWISTNDGLLVLNKKYAIENTLNNKIVEYYKFTILDGLLSNEFNGGCYPASIKTKEGILGFPSMKGYVWFEPDKINLNPFDGEINIDRVLVNDKDVKLTNNNITLNSSQNKLEVFFSIPYFFNRENLTISYKLTKEKNWKEIKNNQIILVREKGEKQKLQIKVHTNGMEEKYDKYKELNINFEPKFYETYLFIGVLFLTIIGLIFITYKVVNYWNLKKRQKIQWLIDVKTKEIEQNRQELIHLNHDLEKSLMVSDALMKEIHHRVKNHLQFLMSILHIQRRKSDMSIEEFVEKTNARLAAIAAIHGQLYENDSSESVEIKQYISTLTLALQNVKDNDFDLILEIEPQKIYLSNHLAVSVGLILNELITNSFKHAFQEQGNYIKIQLKSDSGRLQIVYEDSGSPIEEAEQISKSSGVEIIRILVSQIHGNITYSNNYSKAVLDFEYNR